MWSILLGLCIPLFPTHILIMALDARDRLPIVIIVHLVAFVGNGIIYSVVAQILFFLYFAARKLIQGLI